VPANQEAKQVAATFWFFCYLKEEGAKLGDERLNRMLKRQRILNLIAYALFATVIGYWIFFTDPHAWRLTNGSSGP
jgi:hypothetical protein